MHVRLDLNPVGQGLFYTGQIGGCTFVYDCGSKPYTAHCRSVIDEFRGRLFRQKLDILVVPHFDEDHVSGLERLLNGMRVDYVILPYLLPSERILLAAKNPDAGADYYSLLQDPITYFLGEDARGRVGKVVFVSRGRGGPVEPGHDRKPAPRNYPSDRDIQSNDPAGADVYITDDSISMPEDDDLRRTISRFEDAHQPPGRVLTKTDEGCLMIENYWIFRFYNYAIDQAALRAFVQCASNVLKTDVANLRSGDLHFLRDQKVRKQLASCYKQIPGHDMNNTSLLMYQGPTFRKYMTCRQLRTTRAGYSPRSNYLGPARRTGYFLTGDINLKDPRRQDMENHFEGCLPCASGILVPHHGSKDSWDDKFLDKIRSSAVWYTSAGVNNQYQHPHQPVITALTLPRYHVLNSNEQVGITEEFLYYPHGKVVVGL